MHLCGIIDAAEWHEGHWYCRYQWPCVTNLRLWGLPLRMTTFFFFMLIIISCLLYFLMWLIHKRCVLFHLSFIVTFLCCSITLIHASKCHVGFVILVSIGFLLVFRNLLRRLGRFAYIGHICWIACALHVCLFSSAVNLFLHFQISMLIVSINLVLMYSQACLFFGSAGENCFLCTCWALIYTIEIKPQRNFSHLMTEDI